MNLKSLSTEQLHTLASKLASDERTLIAKSLTLLGEIERRKLYSVFKFESLYHYCVGHLRLSEDQAYRRSRAVRIQEKVEELPKRIAEGTLTLANICKIDTFCREREIHKLEDRAKLLKEVENKTGKECQKILLDHSPTGTPPIDHIKSYCGDLKRIHLTLTGDTAGKLNRVKNLLYQRGSGTYEKIISFMADTTLEKVDRLKRKVRPAKSGEHSRYVPEGIRNAVWQRAGGKCENCNSEFAPEVDHVIPFAKGGTNDLWNLRLLCRSCNQRSKIESFGGKVPDSIVQKIE